MPVLREGTLFRAATDGRQRVQLTWPPLHVAMPHWSPDGKQIAVMAAISGKPDRIYIVPADGGTPRQISNGEAGNGGDWDPTWSPDGASLAFGAAVGEDPDEVFIQVVDLKTRRFSRLPGSQGMWSPAGHPTAASSREKTPSCMIFKPTGRRRSSIRDAGIHSGRARASSSSAIPIPDGGASACVTGKPTS